MLRRNLLILAAAALVSGGGWLATRGDADDNPGTSGTPTLKEVLTNGLKATRPNEKAFIDRVVHRVHHGDLPESLVQGTFLWARQRSNYPYLYFEKALRIQAKSLGVTL